MVCVNAIRMRRDLGRPLVVLLQLERKRLFYYEEALRVSQAGGFQGGRWASWLNYTISKDRGAILQANIYYVLPPKCREAGVGCGAAQNRLALSLEFFLF